jgi:hypothetical protein
MSHRTAFLASIALTVAMALGIFAARDRLFQAGASPGGEIAPAAPSTTTTSSDNPRIIEVTLPQPTSVPASLDREDDGEEGETRLSHTSRESTFSGEREDDEHEVFGDD